ncbi:MAG: O-antigen ligase family protein [Bacteroidales bacterium]|nr:O-antigen ligase family protein [Bacteroidales bacterium]
MQWIKNRKNFHNQFYYWSLVLLMVSMPLSHFLMSVSTLALAINWLLEGEFLKKWRLIKGNKALLIMLLFYFLFLIGLVYTENFSYALKDLKIKLPLFALPIIVCTSEILNSKQLKNILLFFVAAVFIGTIISVIIYFEKFGIEISDTRKISMFISHIRFSLQINLAIFILVNYYINEYKNISGLEKIIYPAGIIWLGIFLLLLKALTGIFIFFIVTIILAFIYVRKVRHLVLKLFIIVLLITIPMLVISYITKAITKFYTIDIVDKDHLESTTVNGNRYNHWFGNDEKENGHYVWIYVCEPEVKKEWNKRSSIPYDSLDFKGHHIKYTLMRYMTSRDLRKDSLGVSKLSPEDIQSIEAGMTNYIYRDRFSLYSKIYEIIWQIDRYKSSGNPSGSSVAQRIEYFKTGKNIIMNNFWTGVGTGDVNDAFMEQYDKNGSLLEDQFRRRAHNQYLTFFITLGVFGFVLCLVSFILPFIITKAYRHFIALVFFLIALLSMINEDTLENHAGVTFIAAFYAILIFGIKYNESNKIDTSANE